ncbi:MAG: winged helix-turn-helix domain-containing protein, partial [Pseudomonadota bacterium]
MYRFNDFELDTERFELRQNGQQVPVEPRVFDFLNLLIENHERVIDRDEIIEKLWDGRFVSEAAISTCVKNARRALGDDGKAQTLIKTVHGKGFRFTGTLTGNQTPTAQPTPNTSPLPSLIILPFQVFGDDPALQASADGLVETLTTVLTRIPMLSIVSRTASFALKDQPIVIDEIQQRFGAWYMLEGSLQTGANGVRVNVQLIETATGHHIWARRIDQPNSPGLVDDLVAQLIPVLEPQLVR